MVEPSAYGTWLRSSQNAPSASRDSESRGVDSIRLSAKIFCNGDSQRASRTRTAPHVIHKRMLLCDMMVPIGSRE